MTTPKHKRLSPETRTSELVQAGLRVLAQGGITAFTIDNICKASGASRGLVGHYFGGKDGLLAACYAAAYAPLVQAVAPDKAPLSLTELIDELLGEGHMNRDGMKIWLALWGEIAVNPALRAEHLRHYRTYRAAIAEATARHFGRDTPDETDETLAAALIALLDGIWLEACIAPSEMHVDRARAAIDVLLRGAVRQAG